MESFFEFLQLPIIQIIGWSFGVVGWFIGIVSGVIQIKSYFEQKTFERAYREIIEQAERNWQGKYTKEQIKDLVTELSKLKKKINHDIPKEARRVYLKTQRLALEKSLSELYSQYSVLLKESSELAEVDNQLPPQLRNAIETAIMPEHKSREHSQKTIYVVIFLALAILVTLNQDGIEMLLSIPVHTSQGQVAIGWVLEYSLFVLFFAFLLNKRFKEALLKQTRSKSTLVKKIIMIIVFYTFLFSFLFSIGVFMELGINGRIFPLNYKYLTETSLIIFLMALPVGIHVFLIWAVFPQIPKRIFFWQKKSI